MWTVCSVQFLKMHIQCGRLCICAHVWKIFVHMCGKYLCTCVADRATVCQMHIAQPMCTVYRMHIDLLSGVYFTVFTVKWFHQFKPQLELRQSENKHRNKAHKHKRKAEYWKARRVLPKLWALLAHWGEIAKMRICVSHPLPKTANPRPYVVV